MFLYVCCGEPIAVVVGEQKKEFVFVVVEFCPANKRAANQFWIVFDKVHLKLRSEGLVIVCLWVEEDTSVGKRCTLVTVGG